MAGLFSGVDVTSISFQQGGYSVPQLEGDTLGYQTDSSGTSYFGSSLSEIADNIPTTTDGTDESPSKYSIAQMPGQSATTYSIAQLEGDGLPSSGSALTKLQSAKQKARQWLASVWSNVKIHHAKVISGAYIAGTNAVTGITRFNYGGAGTTGGFIAGMLGIGSNPLLDVLKSGANMLNPLRMQSLSKAINAYLDLMKDPNIEGIPIHATKEIEKDAVEIGKQVVIVQDSSDKQVVVDNVVPQLRVWQVQGFLMAIPNPLDNYLIIKPSLIVQKRTLLYYRDSQRPVWFKTHDGEYVLCLIEDLTFAYDEKALNACQIDVTLVEFQVLKTATVSGATIFGTKK